MLCYLAQNKKIFKQETYGEDPYLTGSMVQAFMKGLHGPHERYQRATSGCKALAVYSGPDSSRFSFNAKVVSFA